MSYSLLSVSLAVLSDLLKQLQDASSNGDSVAPDQLDKLQEEAERLVQEMKERNLTDQKDAAEKEREQARKREVPLCTHTHTHTHTYSLPGNGKAG